MALRSTRFIFALISGFFLVQSAWAQSLTGDIFVSAEQEGAPILIDGQDTGQLTPAVLKGLELGEHQVIVQTDCGRSSQLIEVTSGRIARAELMTPTGVGTLRILPDPANAQVLLDGQPMASGDSPFTTLDCGVHRVEVRAPGHQSQAREIKVAADSHQEMAVTLQAVLPGTLVVEVYPLTARIYLDGTQVAQGPVTLEPVSVGKHVLMASADGYAQHTQVVEVGAKGVTRVMLELQLANTVAIPVISPEDSAPPTEVTRNETGSENLSSGGGTAGTNPSQQGETSTRTEARPDLTTELPAASRDFNIGKATGAGLSVVGLGASVLAIQHYTVAAAAYEKYLDAEEDDMAQSFWDNEVVPAQRKTMAWGIVGGVSLLSGGIVWVRSSGASELSLGVGPQALEIRGTW